MSRLVKETGAAEQNAPRHGRVARLFGLLGNRLLAGIAFAVPLVVTYWVLAFGYRVVTGLSEPWLKTFGLNIPGLGFAITLVFFMALGFMAAHVIGRRLLERGENLLLRVPVVAAIYAGTKQVLQSLQGGAAAGKSKRVVVVDFFSSGSYLIGFATGHFTEAGTQREMTTVFVPTAPNPTTGLIIAVPSEQVRDCDMTMEEATKMLFSGGLVTPDRPLGIHIASAGQREKTTV
jgi:uncharacterized membrane protein